MKLIPTIARLLLGLIFVVFSLNFWLKFLPMPMPPEGSDAAAFMGVLFTTGFLTVVKILELVGGILLLSGRFVNLGLVILAPIVINIGLFHVFIAKGDYPMSILLGILSLVTLFGRADLRAALITAK